MDQAAPPLRLADEEETIRIWVDELTRLVGSMGWRILMQRLKEERADALEELVDADPNNSELITKLQNKVKRFDWYEETVQELIASGSAEEQQAEAHHDEDELYGNER